MGVQLNVSNLLPVRIQDRERTASSWPCHLPGQKLFATIADNDMPAPHVVTDIVCVQIKRHALQKLIRGSIEDLHCAVATTSHEQPIRTRIVEGSLGLVQSRNRAHLPA